MTGKTEDRKRGTDDCEWGEKAVGRFESSGVRGAAVTGGPLVMAGPRGEGDAAGGGRAVGRP